ncbi:hypothetical protein Poli38472_000813 [Pythium oligandrum]|uniref:Carbohydrate kinase PfkB domain-containing protein n=1 Tax=Pythium oligandrum TaxID=41045 RepID=A0A8K1CCE2_PYTOL|nr:hypothetical protein Poli38472_000813 [Pythium oligandrum]|eukprot:TMW60771.1 hypothetical protein Poli38472_000813 [Pythium oligandrum]
MWRQGGSALRKRLALGDEVIEALYGKNKKPIVALESTIISHGMPFPQNVEMAKAVEDIVRAQGACPATICIADGELKVGLSDKDLRVLGEMGCAARKCSTRDIAGAIAEKIVGATTVSSTMRIAHAAGIRMFVTGGIGGVHRFAEETMDISTDLVELSRTPVAVVCAGIKSILDIPRTLEFLETHSVPVVGYQSDQFPAFFTQDSGVKAQLRRDTPQEVAALIHESIGLELPNGFVVAVPNPNPVSSELISHAIEVGLKEIQDNDIKGQAVTPYLLKRLNEITAGASLGSNIDLVKNNAKVGSQIARALFELDRENETSGVTFSIMEREASSKPQGNVQAKGNVLVVGGLVLDIISASTSPIIRATSNIGTIRQTSGGVGRNIAECLKRLGANPLLVSSIGQDASGSILLKNLEALDISAHGIQISEDVGTAVYSAVLCSSGDLDVAIADMRALDEIDTTAIPTETIKEAKVVIVDGNLSPAALHELLTRSSSIKSSVWFEPTSVQKSVRVVDAGVVPHLTYVSPNGDELAAMSAAIHRKNGEDTSAHARFKLSEGSKILPAQKMSQLKNDCLTLLLEMAKDDKETEKHVIVTLGKHGVLIASVNVDLEQTKTAVAECEFPAEVWGAHHVHGYAVAMVHLPGVEIDVVNCTGAGDSLVGGTVYGLLKGQDIYQSSHLGMAAARKSLVSQHAINPELAAEGLEEAAAKNL